ncbi:MAG: glycerol-3-phosphate dehydrogenase [Chloroflexota bacterium]|nr:glycerol-3-phosphate dehydrogenase [Chloroflexota bacterium]
MWSQNWRNEIWADLNQPWDIIVIGGGITGAGVLREATRAGLRALLVEQRDFAWGTSSRSSKLVHGGLRYLKEGKLRLTRASVRERERLLDEGPGLVDPLGFLLATYKGEGPGRRIYSAGLSIYDLLALQWTHHYFKAADFRLLAPYIAQEGLQGGFQYGDAQTDDARLTLRVIQEAVAAGGAALNYAQVEDLTRDTHGKVTGVRLHDLVAGRQVDVSARLVVNATGAWADQLRRAVGGRPRIRPLRGSHLIFHGWRLPVAQAISFLHPVDRRPVFIFPWEGITLVGTTDVDHTGPLDEEPRISPDEVAYLMAAVETQFPTLGLKLDDILATFAGIRPVISSGRADPSKESRDHVVWHERGLLTVTGGKLTTFRCIALDALKAARGQLPPLAHLNAKTPALNPVDLALPGMDSLGEAWRRRLLGRYGADAPALLKAARPAELAAIPGTHILWGELRWASRAEAVAHLDDLLLRRVRLGLLLPGGGAAILPQVRAICQDELGWDDARWQGEQAAYLALWQRCYSLPDRAAIPDWQPLLARARVHRLTWRKARRRRIKRSSVAGGVSSALVMLGAWLWRRRRRRARGE